MAEGLVSVDLVENQTQPPHFHYLLSNLSVAGPKYTRPLFGDIHQQRHFLNATGFEGYYYAPTRRNYPAQRSLVNHTYQDEEGPLIAAAAEGFRSEGEGKGPFDMFHTIRDIMKHDQPLAAALAFVLLPHRLNTISEIEGIRAAFGSDFPIEVYTDISPFNDVDRIDALGGKLLVQLQQSLITELHTADDLQRKLATYHLSGLILDTTLLQEPYVIDVLSRRDGIDYDENYQGSAEEAIENIFALGLLGDTPIIHASPRRSDLGHRVDMDNANDQILQIIGAKARTYGGDYYIVAEPNARDIQRPLRRRPLQLNLDESTVTSAYVELREHIQALLTAE